MDQGNDGALELWTSASVDGGGGESLPDNRLANVGCNEERDTASETVALLEQLVEQNDNQGSSEKLDDQEDTDTRAKIRGLAIDTGEDHDACLTEGKNNSKKLLGGLVELAIRLEIEVDVNKMRSGEELCNVSKGGGLSIAQTQTLRTWKTMPDEMMGVIPNSIRVPLLLAIIILSQ